MRLCSPSLTCANPRELGTAVPAVKGQEKMGSNAGAVSPQATAPGQPLQGYHLYSCLRHCLMWRVQPSLLTDCFPPGLPFYPQCIKASQPALAETLMQPGHTQATPWRHGDGYRPVCLHWSCPNDKGSFSASGAADFLGFSLPPSKTFSGCLLTQPPRQPHPSACRSLKHSPKLGTHSYLQLSFISLCTGSAVDGQHPCSQVSCRPSSFNVIKSSRSVSSWMASERVLY